MKKNQDIKRILSLIGQLVVKAVFKRFRKTEQDCKLTRNNLIINRSDSVLKRDKLFLNQNLQIGKLAKEVGTNRTYLSRSIKSIKGTTFADYINFHRIAYAKEYMMNYSKAKADSKINDMTCYLTSYKTNARSNYKSNSKNNSISNTTIDDLAIVSGFGSKRNFIRYFKRLEGITPGQYMKGLMVRQK